MTVFQSRKKRFVQAGALALTAALITGVAAQGPRIAEASVYSGEKDARAGVVGELGEFQAKAYATSLTLADSGLSVVAADEMMRKRRTAPIPKQLIRPKRKGRQMRKRLMNGHHGRSRM